MNEDFNSLKDAYLKTLFIETLRFCEKAGFDMVESVNATFGVGETSSVTIKLLGASPKIVELTNKE